MHIVQILAAGYLIGLIIGGVSMVLHDAWTDSDESSVNLTGLPAFVALLAVVVCAVTTLVEVA